MASRDSGVGDRSRSDPCMASSAFRAAAWRAVSCQYSYSHCQRRFPCVKAAASAAGVKLVVVAAAVVLVVVEVVAEVVMKVVVVVVVAKVLVVVVVVVAVNNTLE